MRTFRLSDAAFAALAAGRPSRETLDQLRRAQLSRHLLRLHEIVRAFGRPAPSWYAGPDARTELADPMTALRTAATLTALRDGQAPPPERTASGRVLRAEHAGLALRVRLEDADPLRAALGLTPAGPLAEADAAHWRRCLAEAWRLLVERHRPAAETLAAVLSVIVPVEPDEGAGGISATSAEAFGAVAISAPADATALAVGLLHEAQHSVLNAVRVLFDLVRPTPVLGYSPWRDDPRPPFGILHGAYAYLAVTRFWRAESGPTAAFEFARWRAAVAGAANGLLAGDVLTAPGRRFAGALRDEVSPWLAEPVDAAVARLADGANAEHLARWRLRHLAVDPAAVDALVAAWERGAAPPSIPDPAVRPAPRALEHSDRLAVIHGTLRGLRRNPAPPPGGRLRPGDDAYLRGDSGAALEAYLKELDQVAGWTGLAMVSPRPALRAKPELVRAIHRRTGASPLRIATWLDG